MSDGAAIAQLMSSISVPAADDLSASEGGADAASPLNPQTLFDLAPRKASDGVDVLSGAAALGTSSAALGIWIAPPTAASLDERFAKDSP
jgi:hypothetical protein